MNIFYIKKFDFIEFQTPHSFAGGLDLVSPSGNIFPIESSYHEYLEGVKEGAFIYANIAIGEEKYELDYENDIQLPENEIMYYGERDEIQNRKWLLKTKVFFGDYEWYFLYKGEKIRVQHKIFKPVIGELSKYSEESKIPNEWNERNIIVNMACTYGERYDRHDPLFDAYFNGIHISSVADTPEELLILQAQQEGKTLTLEQAKDIAKDWHFGGAR